MYLWWTGGESNSTHEFLSLVGATHPFTPRPTWTDAEESNLARPWEWSRPLTVAALVSAMRPEPPIRPQCYSRTHGLVNQLSDVKFQRGAVCA